MDNYLKTIRLTNFKNFESYNVQFAKINCFVGKNGVGKTNILEAIHILAMCKAYFYKNLEEDNIRFGEDFFAIHGEYGSDEAAFDKYSCSLKRGEKKKIMCNENRYTKLSEHIGIMPIVVVAPSDQAIIAQGADNQRTFLNYTLAQCDKQYMEALKDYTKVLEMRNKLLKMFQQSHSFDNTQLDSIDYLLSSNGDLIKEKRMELCLEFKQSLQKYYKILSNGQELADLEYETYEGKQIESLQMNLNRDFNLGFTTTGIHKDKLNFTLNGNSVRSFGSQGQQKSVLLALKLAQFDYISRKKAGKKPMLLLDDIFDKFDFDRVCNLLNLILEDGFGQIFITDTHLNRMEEAFSQNNALNLQLNGEEIKMFKLGF
jgi:DNA replication and repair protein RecF